MTADGPDPAHGRQRAGPSIAECPVGAVPILWEYRAPDSDAPPPSADEILDEIALAGFAGTQLGRDFPEGEGLRSALQRRGLRLAEVYAALPATSARLAPEALAIGRERLRLLEAGGGDVLCVALDGCDERDRTAGRAEGALTPHLTDAAWGELAAVLGTLATETSVAGAVLAFHPHAGTFVETPDETARLLDLTDPNVGICLDAGHWIVGGGDPIAAVAWLGERLRHVHLKDVDGGVLSRLRQGDLDGLEAAVGERVFTELGRGMLDLNGLLRGLDGSAYDGWLMVEQDSSWLAASEAAAVGRNAVRDAINALVSDRHKGAISATPWHTPGAGAGA